MYSLIPRPPAKAKPKRPALPTLPDTRVPKEGEKSLADEIEEVRSNISRLLNQADNLSVNGISLARSRNREARSLKSPRRSQEVKDFDSKNSSELD